MEVRLPNAAVPSESAPAFFALRVKFKPGDKDWVTDHTFTSYSKVPPVPLVPTSTAARASSRTAGERRSHRHPRIGRPRIRRRQSWTPLPDARQDLLAELQTEHGFGHESSGRKAVSAASGIRRSVPRTSC